MASEHEHQWEFYPESDEIIFGLCMFPGCHEKKHIPLQKTMYTTIARYRLAELERQLREAQEFSQKLASKNEAFALERVQLQADLAQAREQRDEQMLLAERLQNDLHEVIRQRDDCREENDQARALLEEALASLEDGEWKPYPAIMTWGKLRPVVSRKIRAYLAEHP